MIKGIKLDEDLSPMVAQPLRDAGFIVATVVGQGWSGFKVAELWEQVVAEGFYFITADKGFADIRVRPPGQHPGILLLRPEGESIVHYRNLLAAIIVGHDLNALAGTVTVATNHAIRIRR